MLKFLTESLHVQISCNSVKAIKMTGWLHANGAKVADARLPDGAFSNPERFSEALLGILNQENCKGAATYITLAADVVRLFMVTPPHNVERFADCQAAAAMRFQALYDEVPSSWKIAADWDIHYPFLACAIPQSLLDAIQTASDKHDLKLIEVQPQFVAAYNKGRNALNANIWMGVVQDGGLTLGAFDKKRLCAIRHTLFPDSAWVDDPWLPHYLAREALRLNLAAPQQIQLYGDFPGQWTSRKMGSIICNRLSSLPSSRRPVSVPASAIGAGEGA